MKLFASAKKLFISLALSLICLLVIFPDVAFAADNSSGNSLSDYSTSLLDVGNNNSHGTKSVTSSSKSRSSSSSSKHSSTYIGTGGSIGTAGAVILVVILVGYYVMKKRGSLPGESGSSDVVYISPEDVDVWDNGNMIIDTITEKDPDFSGERFIGWSKEVFMTLQEAWSQNDWSKIRPFEKEELFQLHSKQLDEMKRNKRINIVEKISVNNAYLHMYVREHEYEYITVYLEAEMNDYIISADTKQVIEGNNRTRYCGKYLMTFMRKLGVVTNPSNSNMSTKRCPFCGAPVQITSAGKCEYCDTVITTGDHDWVLSDYECIKPSTHIDNSGIRIR